MSRITLIKCILLECREGEEEMKTLLGYENSLCRDFIRDHLTVMAPEMHIMVAGTNRECLQLAAESSQLSVVGLDTEMLDMDGVTGLRQMIAQCAGLVPVSVIRSPQPRHRRPRVDSSPFCWPTRQEITQSERCQRAQACQSGIGGQHARQGLLA